MNPVAQRELQERFRTLRSPLLVSVWVLIAGAVTFLAYLYASSAAESRLANIGSAGFGSVFAATSMGSFILHAALLGLLASAVFVVPGQAAVMIVGERERQTLPLLQVSQLSASRIIVGKLVSALSFILLLLVVVTPLLVIPVLIGGVTVGEAVAGVGMVAAASVAIGALSMWISARARSMQGAVLGSYVVAALFVFGTLGLVIAEVLLLAPSELGPTRYVDGVARDQGRELYASWLSPVVGMVDASDDALSFGAEVVASPYRPFRQILIKRQGFAAGSVDILYDPFAAYGGGVSFEGDLGRGVPIDALGQPLGVSSTPREVDPIRGGVWWRTLIFEGALTVLALWRSTRLVQVPRSRLFGRGPKEAVDAA